MTQEECLFSLEFRSIFENALVGGDANITVIWEPIFKVSEGNREPLRGSKRVNRPEIDSGCFFDWFGCDVFLGRRGYSAPSLEDPVYVECIGRQYKEKLYEWSKNANIDRFVVHIYAKISDFSDVDGIENNYKVVCSIYSPAAAKSQ
jgi:hypothetical protein